MPYNFDNTPDRRNTDSVKYDGMKAVFSRDDLLPLWVADTDFPAPGFIINALKERMKHPVFGYSVRGDGFYDSIIYWLEKQHRWKVSRDEIVFSPGVVPGMLTGMMAVSQPGDKIIAQPPVYFPFFTTIKENGRTLVLNPLKEENGDYTMDFDHLLQAIDQNTRAIFISQPHNPVGRAWSEDEIHRLVDICYQNKVIILSDEIHSDLVYSPRRHIPIASTSDKAAEITITLMAPSKTFNVAGLSTSFGVIKNQTLKKRYENVLNALHLGQGNIFGAVALQAAYSPQGRQWLEALHQYLLSNIRLVDDFFKNEMPDIEFRRPEATFLLWIDMRQTGFNERQIRDLWIKKARLGINPGVIFGREGSRFIRMNIGTSKKILEQALNQLQQAWRSL